METKLTYENMYKLVSDYFQNFEGVPDAGLEDGKASVAKYFSKDLITRRRCWPSLTNLDEWMAVLVDNYPNHRYDINIDKPYGYVCIDPESGLCCIQMREDVHGLFDGVGGERVRLTEDGLPERAENGKKKEDCYAAVF